MTGIVDTLSTGISLRRIQSLRTDSQFLGRNLTEMYTIGHWLNDGTVDKEAKRFIATTAAKAPFVDSMMEELQGDRLAEFRFDGLLAVGLGVAVLMDEAALSASRDGWRNDPITLRATYVTEAATEEKDEDVCNVHSPACLLRRGDWFEERARLATKSGTEVLADAHGLFRWLQFGPRAQDQLRALHGREPEFVVIVRHLAALSARAANWRDGIFADGYPFPCSPESQPTMNMYGDERRFVCPDGLVRQFSWHSKVSIGARRIYFLAERPGQPVTIGYVGSHLRTVAG